MANIKGYKAIRFVERAIERAIQKGLFSEVDINNVDPCATGGKVFRCKMEHIFGKNKNLPIIAGGQRTPYDPRYFTSDNLIDQVSKRTEKETNGAISVWYMTDRVMHHDYDEPWIEYVYVGRLEYDLT